MEEFWKAFIGEGLDGMKKSPLASIIICLMGLAIGVFGSHWFYNDRLSSQNERMERIKLAAGMATPSGKTSLTELTNYELKLKANRLVNRIREIVDIHWKHKSPIFTEKQSGRITAEEFKSRFDDENYRAWTQFETVRVEALMTLDELRERLPSRIREKIETAKPHFSSSDEPKAVFSPSRLITRPFLLDAALMLAGEIEELSKLQLETFTTCSCKE